MIAPVDVPATNENVSHAGRPVCSSRRASTIAGMIPRSPPPSSESKYFGATFDLGALRWLSVARLARRCYSVADQRGPS